MPRPAAAPLDALTSLRFFAALAVALYHVPYVLPHSVGLSLLPNGGLGVSFFFILSGFILKHVYPRPGFPLAEFYRRRAARILPLHYLTLILWIGLFFNGWGNSLSEKANSGVANALLLQAFFSGPLFNLGYNAVSWSISVEIFFYALFPFLLRGHRHGIVFAVYVLTFLLMPEGLRQWLVTAFPDFFYFNPFSRLLEFTCGMSLHALFRMWQPRPRLASVLQIGSLVALVVLVQATAAMPTHLRNVALLLPFSAVILAFAWEGLPSRFLAWPGFVLLGEASFALYLVHHMYFRWMDDWLAAHFGPWPALGLALASLVLLSVLVFRAFERPAREALTRRGQALREPAARPDPAR
jgi:peptidoglycan/LPS O-acetylase OafA/YrhL